MIDHKNVNDLPRLGGASYSNPLPSTDGLAHTRPDPFAFKHRGRYYVYATAVDGVTVSVSDDLVTWEFVGYAFQLEDRRNYWAPCAIYADGTVYLYVSSAPAGSTDSHDERLHVATSADPLGPFALQKTFFDKFSIDAHVVRDRDGEYYMYYSTNDVTGLGAWNAGTSILVDRMPALDELAGEPQAVVIPTLPEEIFEENRFGDGRDWHTIEGATFIRHRDQAFLTYSGNAYVRENYFVGYSRAVDGGSIGDLTWTKYPSDYDFAPLIRRNEVVEGTGHNSIITAPNLVDQWIVYHGREAADPLTLDVEQRTMRIDPLYVDGDRLATNAPSSAEQDAPAAPDAHDLFDGPRFSSVWADLAGTWTTGDDAARTAATDAHALAVTARVFGSYRAEIDLAADLDHAGARYGVVPVYLSPDDLVELTIDAGLQRITATRVRNNLEHELASATLPALRLDAFHQLQLDRSLGHIAVALDGVPVLEFDAPEGPAAFGLHSTHTAARFSGFALTEHLELWGETLGAIDRFYAATPRVAVTASGVEAPTGCPLELRSLDHAGETAYEHELEVLSRARGRVEYVIGDADGDHVRIDADVTSARVIHVVSGEEVPLGETALASPRFSVRTVVTGDRLALRIGGIALVLPRSTPQVTQHLRLTAAKLRGFQATSVAGIHREEK